jgi:hypothetical protein
MSVELGNHATSLSCAISCVTIVDVSKFQTVDVMPIEDMTTRFGIVSFRRGKGKRIAALAWKAVEGKPRYALGAARTGRKRK